MFDDIFKLPAGHTLTVENGHYNIKEYWDLEYHQDQQVKTLADYREQLKYLMEEAVRVRLMSDVPLGAFLSGGIDSSLVVGLMSKLMNQPVKTYSVGFAERELNELPYARTAAEHLGTDHHEIAVDICTPQLIEKLVWHLDEPLADPAAVPTFLVSQLARETVTVVLTGEGGDELFAGYGYYQARPWAKLGQMMPGDSNQWALPALANSINSVLGRQRYHERSIWYMSLPEGARMAAWVAIFTDAAKERLYCDEFGVPDSEFKPAFARYYNKYKNLDELHRLMYIDTKVWLADDLLMKVDKMSMAASLEARCPFLDHRLMEFVGTMPANMKLNGETSKFILKEVAKEILPHEIVNRPKHSFDVPIGKWIKGSLREMTLDLISDGIVEGGSLFKDDYILKEMWPALEADQPGVARQFWGLINLGLWSRKYNVELS
jgi:asparagine synthase (glutamine-hydrolysing)